MVAGANPLGCSCTPTPSSHPSAWGPAVLCHLPAAAESPRPGHHSLPVGTAPSRDPGLSGEVPLLLPPVVWLHPVAGPLPPRPVPAPQDSRGGESRARLALGSGDSPRTCPRPCRA